jgi:hypothetical protein
MFGKLTTSYVMFESKKLKFLLLISVGIKYLKQELTRYGYPILGYFRVL